ncbi:Helix-turn-helix domain-containing protein [Actinacidiphila yanglinensis]|uniref:Helix-turn-helix domain-containing protein n=1 Tax=Actinacidiphila yanglinensis TaxID=310779 RepID=A0A1H6B801_9ACTN|nr:helix-turn-helix domain-containing protein [Actinacidiphila yanglinensis]SEG56246.1 Helix-turn-helix domain-containing protein [Actinacidiphila yanglinensis]
MPHPTGSSIGARLRETRKRRGLSQRELAGRSGVSLSLIRKLEQGERADTRVETARALAAALGVPTTRLLGGERETPGAAPAVADRWAPVRAALEAPSPGPSDDAPTVAGVRRAVAAAVPLAAADRLDQLGAVLPGLLRDAAAVADSPAGRRVQADLLGLTGWLFTQTRQFDAADVALTRALDGAGDDLDVAAAVSTSCWLLLRRGRIGAAGHLAETWADRIEPRMSRATPGELAAWGWLLLRAAAAADRDARSDDAERLLRLAGSAASAVGDLPVPGGFLRAFDARTVQLKDAEHAMISDRPDRVLQLSETISWQGMRPTSNNLNRNRLDQAAARVRLRRYAEAVDTLELVRHAAPQWLPHQRYAQDILGQVIARRRTLTPRMRLLADAVGVPL